MRGEACWRLVEATQDLDEVTAGINALQQAGADQRVKDGGGLRTAGRPGEVPVVAALDGSAKIALSVVVVAGDLRRGQEYAQPVSLVVDVLQGRVGCQSGHLALQL